MAACLFSPLLFVSLDGIQTEVSPLSFCNANDSTVWSVGLFVIGSISILLSIVAIFMFKDRKRQIRITRWNVLFLIGFMVYLLLFLYLIIGIDLASIHLGWGALMPILAIAFALMANNKIKKDEALVKSLNRLR
jgi:hypothetical protein